MGAPTFVFSHRGALGDFLLTWPVLKALRIKYSHHAFLGIGKPEYIKLACHFNLVDEVRDCESKELLDFYAGRRMPACLKNPDIILCWMQEDSGFECFLRSSGVHRFCIHPPFPTIPKQHAMDHHLQLLDHFSISQAGQKNFTLFQSLDKNGHILIHPGSGSKKKNYTPEFYAALKTEFVPPIADDVRIILGPGECHLKNFYQKSFQVIEPGSLIELSKMIGTAKLFIGNDSGMSHLAALMGISTIAFFKASDPEVWGTRGQQSINLKAETESHALQEFRKAILHFFKSK